jgi:hypothetical protein
VIHRASALALKIGGAADAPVEFVEGGWSKDDHDTAVKMRLEGRGATEIGEVIGRTRLAVIGHLWRHGIRGRLKPQDGGRISWERAKGL